MGQGDLGAEGAVRPAFQGHVAADPQQHHVAHRVAVEVDRVSPGHPGRQVGAPVLEHDPSRPGAVAQQDRRRRAARREQLGPPVGVAIPDGEPAADEMLPAAGIVVRGHGDRLEARAGLGRARREDQGQPPHAGTIRSPPSAASTACPSASAPAPRAQIELPQAWISTGVGARPPRRVAASISPSTSRA